MSLLHPASRGPRLGPGACCPRAVAVGPAPRCSVGSSLRPGTSPGVTVDPTPPCSAGTAVRARGRGVPGRSRSSLLLHAQQGSRRGPGCPRRPCAAFRSSVCPAVGRLGVGVWSPLVARGCRRGCAPPPWWVFFVVCARPAMLSGVLGSCGGRWRVVLIVPTIPGGYVVVRSWFRKVQLVLPLRRGWGYPAADLVIVISHGCPVGGWTWPESRCASPGPGARQRTPWPCAPLRNNAPSGVCCGSCAGGRRVHPSLVVVALRASSDLPGSILPRGPPDLSWVRLTRGALRPWGRGGYSCPRFLGAPDPRCAQFSWGARVGGYCRVLVEMRAPPAGAVG